MDSDSQCRRFKVEGKVQGVGFRYFTQQAARGLGVRGWVKNCPDGTVEALAVGTASQLEALEAAIGKGPSLGRVRNLQTSEEKLCEVGASFEIVY